MEIEHKERAARLLLMPLQGPSQFQESSAHDSFVYSQFSLSEVAMILDARLLTDSANVLDAPVVIIGGGTVGLFLAVTLAQARISTIVVEAGGQVADTSRSAETAVSMGKPHAGVTFGRAFGLGGTSTLWRGQLAEFDAKDLMAPGREWPIAYSELQRWYRHVYTFLKLKQIELPGERTDAASTKPAQETGIERFSTFLMPQQNFASRFREEVKSSSYLKILLHATVNDILFEGPNATAVQTSVLNKPGVKISGRAFVFASGTLETCRFFLSTQRKSNVPWKFDQQIGTYFQDHIVGPVAKVQLSDERKFRDCFENGYLSGIKYQVKLRNRTDFDRPSYSGMAGSFAFPSRLQENFDNVKFLLKTLNSGIAFSKLKTLPADVWSLGRALYPLTIRFLRHRRLMVFMDRGVEFVVQAEQIPTNKSAIRLMEEAPQADGLFRAAVHWTLDGKEIVNIRDFSYRVDKYLKQNNIASLQIDERLQAGDASLLEQFGDFYHQAGGMCIGSSPSTGVLDSDCRPWNAANVFVAGACVFPTSSHANVTLTALAMTARLAALLEKQR